MKKWIRPQKTKVPIEIREKIGGHPLVADTLYRRGFQEISKMLAFMNPEFYQPSSPYELPGMKEAVGRIIRAVKEGERILVWGDFDVDGQTSTTLLVSALRKINANLSYHIPNREIESHGVNMPKLKDIFGQKIPPSIVLTCDTGITAIEAVKYAKTKNVDFIITDHHQIPEVLPDAVALVNPNFLDTGHPMRNLPGVGVAFELARALFELRGIDENIEDILDLVTLGIIADVARLDGDTRYLAQKGLEILGKTERIGLQELYYQAKIETERINEEQIGYVIAPRLNAVGRLGDANSIVELLTTKDRKTAREMVLKIEGLNRKRRLLMGQVYRAAIEQIEKKQEMEHKPVIVLAHHGWPAGIIGIVASRIAERYGKPTILISTQPNGKGHASARSIEGLDITAAIATQRKILDHFGGHPMAAGFAIDVEDIPQFKVGISNVIEKMGIPEEPSLVIDQVVSWDLMDMTLIEQVERLAPYGAGNPALIFVSDGLSLSSKKIVGEEKEHLLLKFSDQNGNEKKVVWWHGAEEFDASRIGKEKGSLAYIARRSNYLGTDEVSIQFVDFHPLGNNIDIRQKKDRFKIIDLRNESDPLDAIAEISNQDDFIIWAEGSDGELLKEKGYSVSHRIQLRQSKRLVIWTVPPNHDVLRVALNEVSPEEVVIIGRNPKEKDLQSFLDRLSSLVKYSINHRAGEIPISDFAALLASNEQIIIASIKFLSASGMINILENNRESIKIERKNRDHSRDYEELSKRLQQAIHQSNAYRSFFVRAPIKKIMSQ